MALLTAFVILATGLFGFLAIILNITFRLLFGSMCVYGIYLVVNIIPNIATSLNI